MTVEYLVVMHGGVEFSRVVMVEYSCVGQVELSRVAMVEHSCVGRVELSRD